MTANQIAYAKHLEDSRHNRIQEKHEHYSTRTARIGAMAQQSQATTAALRQSEDARHNQETERVNWWAAQETGRHNQESERLSAQQNIWNREFQQNQSEAAFRQASAAERRMSAGETDAETRRRLADLESTKVKLQDYYNRAGISQRQAELGYQYSQLGANMGLAYSQLAESSRHNVEQESIGRTNATSQRISANAAAENVKVNKRHATVAERNAATNEKNATSQRINSVANVGNAIAGIGRTLVPLIGGTR